ncbi:MAG TPA: OpgC domain-containing protein, partial [Stellaceae bacterium]
YTVMTFHNPMYNDEMRVGDFLGEPHVAVIEALLLQFQPTYLDILPVYIVLLATFPLVIIGLRWRPLVVLLPSVALYVLVQALNLSVPAYPPGSIWYFNPLAWQFLFTTGAALSLGVVPANFLYRSKRALLAAAVILVVGFVVRFSWTIHGLWDPFPGLLLRELWPVNKTNLSPLRLVPFLAAVALVAALVPPGAAFLRSAAARPLVLCGRQSLEIFCLGILLSALGHFVLSEYETGVPAKIAVNAVGIAIMYLTARTIDWYKTMGRAPSRPVMAASPSREDGFGG